MVVNLSSKTLDEPTQSGLNKGLNFVVAPTKIPFKEIICGVEMSLKEFPMNEAEEVRGEVCWMLKVDRPPKPNVTRSETEALCVLHHDESFVVLKSDKGNVSVILECADSHVKMVSICRDESFLRICKDPTRRIQRQITKLLKATD